MTDFPKVIHLAEISTGKTSNLETVIDDPDFLAVFDGPKQAYRATPDPTINWERLARQTLHPLKVQILEAIAAAKGPMSPNQLSKQLGERLGNVSYHVGQLVEAQALVLDHTEPRRGAVEHFYVVVGS